jgi:hypothetical protein
LGVLYQAGLAGRVGLVAIHNPGMGKMIRKRVLPAPCLTTETCTLDNTRGVAGGAPRPCEVRRPVGYRARLEVRVAPQQLLVAGHCGQKVGTHVGVAHLAGGGGQGGAGRRRRVDGGRPQGYASAASYWAPTGSAGERAAPGRRRSSRYGCRPVGSAAVCLLPLVYLPMPHPPSRSARNRPTTQTVVHLC